MIKTNGKLLGAQSHPAQQSFHDVAGVAEKPARLAAIMIVIRAHLSALKLAPAHPAPVVLKFGQGGYVLGTEPRSPLSLSGHAVGPVIAVLFLALAASLGLGLVDRITVVGAATLGIYGVGVVFAALGLSALGVSHRDARLINHFVRVT